MARVIPAVTTTERGQVVAAYGRRWEIEAQSGAIISCTTRAKRGGYVCGDWVRYTSTGAGTGVIESLDARTSLLLRSDDKREKPIAANVTQIVIVIAVTPVPNADLIDRCLAASERAGTRALVVLNKIDLEPGRDHARMLADLYAALGYRCVETSEIDDIAPLATLLMGQTSVMVGQSGVGKSTLLNRLVPTASARVGTISHARQTGRHTTTHAALYRIDPMSALIDSPGLQAFGLGHLAAPDLAAGFVEFRPHLGECRFADCRHAGEPQCAIDLAARTGAIAHSRLDSYRRILAGTRNGTLSRASSPR